MSRNTSVTLNEHFDHFIAGQIEAGRYDSTSEVIRAGLRLLEAHESRLALLKAHLAVGEQQANNGQFVNYNYHNLMAELDAEGLART